VHAPYSSAAFATSVLGCRIASDSGVLRRASALLQSLPEQIDYKSSLCPYRVELRIRLNTSTPMIRNGEG